MAASHSSRTLRFLGATAAVTALLAGCARFPSEHSQAWREQPSLEPQVGPEPSFEGEQPPPPEGDPGQQPQPQQAQGCTDPDPSVVATCLGPIGAVAALPDGNSALVGERMTGRILRVQRGREPVEITRLPVDPAGDGGLTGLALSPTYQEDELFYAYVTTGEDNRVVRIAAGDSPKPVLTGIPKGPERNSGAILDDGRGALMVATGNAGSAEQARDPASLAGKVLRIDGFGAPAQDNPDPASPVIASGLSAPGGLCGVPEGSGYWVTDRRGPRDELYQVRPGTALNSPAWTWEDRPGVAGCVADASVVVVALTDDAALYTLHPNGGGTFTGEPTKVMENTYGRFSAASLAPDGHVWMGTTNKAGGQPVPSDDRVLRIQPPTGGSAGKD